VTRHPEQGKVVLSHWRDGVCAASTPVEVGELPELIAVLADALGDAIRLGEPSGEIKPHTYVRLVTKLKTWLRPRLGQVLELRTSDAERADTDRIE
jgi:hypothetical protein